MSEGKPYVPLGEVIAEIAARKNVRGPERIANYIRARKGFGPTGVAVRKWMYGESRPNPKKGYLELFADAFEATEEERVALAYADTFLCPIAA